MMPSADVEGMRPLRPLLALLLASLLALSSLAALPAASATSHRGFVFSGSDPSVACSLTMVGKEMPGGTVLLSLLLSQHCPSFGASHEQCSVTGSPAAGYVGGCALSGANSISIAPLSGGPVAPGLVGGVTTVTFGACPASVCFSFIAQFVYNV